MKRLLRKVKSIYRKAGEFLSKVTSSFWNSNIVVALSTIPFYYACKLQKGDEFYISLYIIVWTCIKCGYFILFSLEKIAETYTEEKSFNWFLKQFTIVFFLLIFSFGIDNLLLFDIDHNNFNGTKHGNLFELAFDFCHYSFMTFTTVGFGEINAASRIAKFYSVLEVFIGFVFVGYILSGFSSIKEGMVKDKPFNIDYDEVKQRNKEIKKTRM